jgi:hypothetical protein
MHVSVMELSYSSMDVLSAIKLCRILNTTVENYFFIMGEC